MGWLLFSSTRRLPLSAFFKFTNFLLILFAAGLVAHGVHGGTAGKGRRDGHDVAPREYVAERFGLVRVELLDPARTKRRYQPIVRTVRERRKCRRDRRHPVRRRDDWVRIPAERGRRRGQSRQDLLQQPILVSGDDGQGLIRHGKC